MSDKEYVILYSPALLTCFVSAVFGALNFCSTCLELDASALFTIGILRAVLGLLFFVCAIIQIFKGEIYGNINLVFSIIFGFFSGANMIVNGADSLTYQLIQPDVFAFIQLAAGFYLGLLLPAIRSLPFYQWTGYGLMAISLIFLGSGNFLGIQVFEYVAGFLNFIFCLINIYAGLRAIEEKIPMGKTTHQMLFEYPHGNHHRKRTILQRIEEEIDNEETGEE